MYQTSTNITPKYRQETHYIISRKQGLIQYNEFGLLSINANVPKSLKRYKK
jgi:hypothetical protein